MKIAKIVVIIVFIVYFTGCSHYFAYRSERWKTKTEVEKMKVTKLDNQSIKADSINGYWGVIENRSRRRGHSNNLAHFCFSGPEKFSVALGAGQQVDRYLLPGIYNVVVSYRGNPVDTGTIYSDNRLHDYNGIDVHWYVSWTNPGY